VGRQLAYRRTSSNITVETTAARRVLIRPPPSYSNRQSAY